MNASQAAVALTVAAALAGCGRAPTEPPLPPVPPGDPLVPPPPPFPKAGDGPGATFVVSRVRLGALDASGAPDPNAWRALARNLDGRDDQGPDHPGHCAPVGGADVLDDGAGGTDDVFGAYVVPQLLEQLSPTVEEDTNARISGGDWNLVLSIDALGDGSGYAPLASRVQVGAPTPTPPALDGTDAWPVASGSIVPLAASYVTGGTWVSAPPAAVPLRLDVAGYLADLEIRSARLLLTLADDRTTATGILVGILDPEALVAHVGPFSVFAGLAATCNDPTNQVVGDAIRSFADLPLVGPHDSNQPCSGISVGIGLELVRGELGPEVTPPPPPDPCAL